MLGSDTISLLWPNNIKLQVPRNAILKGQYDFFLSEFKHAKEFTNL